MNITHDKMKSEIIDICLKCLTLRENIIQENEYTFTCYIGGGRQYHPQEQKSYTRTIYLGSGSKRYDNIPEDIIDLNEVYFLYKRKNKLTEWDENIYHPLFAEIVESLKLDGTFLILETRDLISDNFEAILFDENWESKRRDSSIPPEKTLRFIKLNPNRTK